MLIAGLIFASIKSGLIDHLRSRSWPTARATVTQINEEEKSAIIHYQYVVDGIDYVGNNLSFLSAGTLSDKSFILDTYWPRQEIQVHFNPGYHSESVILIRTVRA